MKERRRGKFHLLKNEWVHQPGYESLAVWVVMVALQDAERCVKGLTAEFRRANPEVNLYEIRKFMTEGFLTTLFDIDGAALFDWFIEMNGGKR